MKKTIGSILLVIWFLALAICIGEEPGDIPRPENPAPEWAGYVVVALWFLLPITAIKLLEDKTKQ